MLFFNDITEEQKGKKARLKKLQNRLRILKQSMENTLISISKTETLIDKFIQKISSIPKTIYLVLTKDEQSKLLKDQICVLRSALIYRISECWNYRTNIIVKNCRPHWMSHRSFKQKFKNTILEINILCDFLIEDSDVYTSQYEEYEYLTHKIKTIIESMN
tara:strand:+ start:128 stop:610 length:483 start_codon:yes stop_codon:yes gene_type:complete